MRPSALPQASVVPRETTLAGGLDLVSPPGRARPGTARFAVNYEVDVAGGYRRAGGIERFSGASRPHLAAYVVLDAAAGWTGAAIGDTLTGQTSGATARVIRVEPGRLVLTERTVTAFVVGETVKKGAAVVGVLTDDTPTLDGFLDNELSELAANHYRALIAQPPGYGPIRGLAVLNGAVLCWRDAAAGGGLRLYKATTGGWVLVSTPAMLGGGRVRTVAHSFTGSTIKKLYGCDGVNQEWVFDGTTLAFITTGMAGQRAQCVVAHKQHLFFAYGSSLQHSSTGDPLSWTPVTGAAELSAGDAITNLVPVAGSETAAALMVLCRDSALVLYGTDAGSWQLNKVSDEAGAQPDSAQEMRGIMAFDRDAFRGYLPTQTFGNFSYESASRQITPLVGGGRVVASVLAKDKGAYRCFFADGLIASATPGPGGSMQWMALDYERVASCALGAEIGGEWRVFFGGEDGWVYECDVGRSFDGGEVLASMRLSADTAGADVVLKQFRIAEMHVEGQSAFNLAMAAEFDSAIGELAAVEAGVLTTNRRKLYGTGLFWDFNSWDRAYWDGAISNRVRFPVRGQGRSVSLLVQSQSATELPHTLKAVTTLHTPRRFVR